MKRLKKMLHKISPISKYISYRQNLNYKRTTIPAIIRKIAKIVGGYTSYRINWYKYAKKFDELFENVSFSYHPDWYSCKIQISTWKRTPTDELVFSLQKFCRENGFDFPKVKIASTSPDEKPTAETKNTIDSDICKDGKIVLYFRAFSATHCQVEVKEVTSYQVVNSCIDELNK